MTTNLDRYKKDLDSLIKRGQDLQNAIQFECYPKEARATLKNGLERVSREDNSTKQIDFDKAVEKFVAELPDFKVAYQPWHSEARAFLKQVLPDRLDDFIRLYDKPKARKKIGYESYRIEDYMQGLTERLYSGETIYEPSAAIPHVNQQIAIIKSAKARFESSLFEIRQLVQADLLDSELDAARELLTHKFVRAAGALAGVALEKHLLQVCENHKIKILKKKPTLNDLNQALKDGDAIKHEEWRFNQFLADIRNSCDHDRQMEPTEANVTDLINGVAKVTKTLF